MRPGRTLQVLGGPLVASLSFTLDRDLGLVSRLLEPTPRGLETALRDAHADLLVVDHTALAPALAAEGGPGTVAVDAACDDVVDAVVKVYPPDRVILVRGHLSRFFWDGKSVVARTRLDDADATTRLRQVLRHVDERFAERTGCHVVHLAADHLPRADQSADDLALGPDFTLAVEAAVARIARAPTSPTPPAREAVPGPLPDPEETFASTVHRDLLAGAIDPTRVAALLTAGGPATFEDAAALAAAVVACPDAEWEAVAALARSGGGRPAEAMRARFIDNRNVLAAHPHTYVDLTGLEPDGRLVVRLADHFFLAVGEASIAVQPYGRRPDFDPQAFVERGYVCGPDEVDDALESWAAYLERGRRRDTTPFQLTFRSHEAFRDSLYHLDYGEILANENYCITLDGRLPHRLRWEPRVDTRFLFDPLARVCILRNGLGDQLFHYVHTRHLADKHGLRLFADDLYFDDTKARQRHLHSRPDILSLARFDGVFSELFSRRLRLRRRSRRQVLVDRSEYVALGLREQVLAVDRLKMAALLDRGIDPGALTVCVLGLDQLDHVMAEPPGGVLFVDVLAKDTWLKYSLMRQKSVWERSLRRGEFVSARSAEICERMLATDAIVVHVRRGDRAVRGMANDDGYYRDFMQRTASLEEYPNKHWFVFSDDHAYCRAHRAELGLDLAGEAITFVEGNHHFATLDDFFLMTLGKVMVCGESGFSLAAALMSTRVDHIFGAGRSTQKDDGSWRRPPRRRGGRNQLDRTRAGSAEPRGRVPLAARLRRALARFGP